MLGDVFSLVLNIVRPIARSLRDNSGLAALAIVLAFGLWIVVKDAENPTETRRLPEAIPVRPVNVPPDVWVPEIVGSVNVRVAVEKNVFDSLRQDEFRAVVDLENLDVGKYDDLAVDVRPLTGRGGLRIEEVLPTRISVELSQLVSKSVRVVVQVTGEPPSDYVMSAPEPDRPTVVISGPQARVDLVTQAVATLDADGRSEDVEQALRLEPLDQRGQLVEGVSVEPSLVKITADIKRTAYQRALVVSPQLIGVPAAGYNVSGVSVNPVTVIVSGSASYIDQAVEISTQPVDVDAAEEDVVRTVSLDVPEGAKVIGNVTVTVTIRIVAASGQTAFAVPLSVNGLGDGLTVKGSLPTVEVLLLGPLPTLLAMNPGDLTAAIDVSGKKEGKYTLTIEIDAPEGLVVSQASPFEVDVVLESR